MGVVMNENVCFYSCSVRSFSSLNHSQLPYNSTRELSLRP